VSPWPNVGILIPASSNVATDIIVLAGTMLHAVGTGRPWDSGVLNY